MVEGSSKGCYLLPSASAWRQGARQDLIKKNMWSISRRQAREGYDILRNAPTWRVERMVHHSSIGGVPAEQTEGGNKQQLSYGHEVEQSQLQSNRTENLVRWTKEARQAYIRGAVDKSNRVR